MVHWSKASITSSLARDKTCVTKEFGLQIHQVPADTVVLSEVNQKEESKCLMLMCICEIQKNGIGDPIHRAEIETVHMDTKEGRGWHKLGEWG